MACVVRNVLLPDSIAVSALFGVMMINKSTLLEQASLVCGQQFCCRSVRKWTPRGG